jgi:hypothetical protein
MGVVATGNSVVAFGCMLRAWASDAVCDTYPNGDPHSHGVANSHFDSDQHAHRNGVAHYDPHVPGIVDGLGYRVSPRWVA